MRLVLVNVHLVGGEERLPDNVDPPHTINGRLSRRRGSLRIWMENALHLHGWGGHPTAVKRPGVSAHT
jgi:hypothetical protein